MASVDVRQDVQDDKVTRCPDDDANDCTNAVDKESFADSMEEEKEEEVFTRENRGGSAQSATHATPTRSSHGPMNT